MAGYIGKIEPFDEGQETWTNYQERLEEYFAVNEIANDKKVSALLTLLGGKTRYHDLPERTETDRNGPKRTFVDTETDSLSTETDSLGTETERNGLSWIPKRTL